MNITALSEVQGATVPPETAKLREACDAIEGMFLKTLLKEGLKSMMDNAEGHTSSALGFALEETADEMARNGDCGIANSIYEKLSANM